MIQYLFKNVFWKVQDFPLNPVAIRKPVCPVKLPNDNEANLGDSVIIDLYNSNRDKKIFGDDADKFNPYREPPSGQNLWTIFWLRNAFMHWEKSCGWS